MHRFVLAAALCAVAVPALAQETRASAAAKLATEIAATDTNRDGVLRMPEVQTRMARMKVGTAPMSKNQATMLARLWFARTDANKDGKVTRAESQATLKTVFDRYDTNDDGKVTAAERAAAAKAAKAEVAR